LDDEVIVSRRNPSPKPPGDVLRLGPALERMRGPGWAEGKLPQSVSSYRGEPLKMAHVLRARPKRATQEPVALGNWWSKRQGRFWEKAPSTCFSSSMIPNHCSVASSAQNLCCSVIFSAWRGGGLKLGVLPRLGETAGNWLFDGHRVSFIVNRSTHFFWQSEDFSALRRARRAGSMSRPIPSAMPRAATNGYWNGCRCRIGMKIWESSSRNVRSSAPTCRKRIWCAPTT
jgi:hypothetical protein